MLIHSKHRRIFFPLTIALFVFFSSLAAAELAPPNTVDEAEELEAGKDEKRHAPQTPLRLMLFGDTPYGGAQERAFKSQIAWLNRQDRLDLVVHVGDIKGGELCSEAELKRRRDLFAGVEAPLLYLPGDNEWTDCHRWSMGAFDPLSRLALIRQLFFRDQDFLQGLDRPITRQSADYPEHQRFHLGDLSVITAHVVGSLDGMEPWSGIYSSAEDSPSKPLAARIQEVQLRQQAVAEWLAQSLEAALANNSRALVLVIHGNPLFEKASTLPAGTYQAFHQALRTLLAGFDGPVLLLHGDLHELIIDQPWAKQYPQLMRVQSYGFPSESWLQLDIDTSKVEQGAEAVFQLHSRYLPRPIRR